MIRLASTTVLLASLTCPLVAQSLELRPVVGGLVRATWAGSPPADFQRVFVMDFRRIQVVRDGVLQAEPFFLSSEDGDVRDIWSVAFHPDFTTNGRLFLVYDDVMGDSAVAEFTVSATNPDRIDYASKRVIFGPVLQPATDHSFGDAVFAVDGSLLVSTGDGGPQLDPLNSAQDRGGPFGKLLRLRPDLPAPHVPLDNPWTSDPGGLDAVWAYGLRMPWRITIDALTGDLWIADVGQASWEEIDFVPQGAAGGLNFGWRCREGSTCSGLGGCDCTGAALVDPIHAYPHDQGRCAVIGGQIYRGGEMPWFDGRYFFSDFCDHRIRSLARLPGGAVDVRDHTDEIVNAGSLANPASIGADGRGELLVVDLLGTVYRLQPVLPEPWPEYCFGDGSGCAACPCANEASAGSRQGCAHAGGRGARLRVTGWPSVLSDGLRFDVVGAPANSFAVLVSGEARLAQAGACIGAGLSSSTLDGLRCVGGGLQRHGVRATDAEGRVGVTTPAWGEGSGLLAAAGFASGQMRHFQVVYRTDPAGGCGSGQGTSQAASRIFAP